MGKVSLGVGTSTELKWTAVNDFRNIPENSENFLSKFNENPFIEADIQPAPTPGITTLEDCADGCSAHPECKAFVLFYGNTCHYKSSDDIPLVPLGVAVSGSINTCYYTKIVQDGPK